MNNTAKKIASLLLPLALVTTGTACSGSSGGGDDTASGSDSVSIEGTIATASTTSRVLAAGDGGIAGVTVSALGDSATSDEFGNFNLSTDGTLFTGGPVEFTVSGGGVDGSAIFDDVAGGPGAMAFIDLMVEEDGSITGTSTDASGTVLSEITGSGKLGCSQEISFRDGGGGALWKPVSESTGTVVVLMPSSYRDVSISLLDSNGNSVASVIRTRCCDTNGNRAHWWWSRSASSLASESTPLTVRFEFADGFVDCRTVPDPRQRYD